ncbi:MAG: holo-ACP synthase, partial [Actinomyces sp.]
MRGLGVDLVSLPEFASQVREPGSAFLNGVLTPREARRVRARAASTSGAQPGSVRYD